MKLCQTPPWHTHCVSKRTHNIHVEIFKIWLNDWLIVEIGGHILMIMSLLFLVVDHNHTYTFAKHTDVHVCLSWPILDAWSKTTMNKLHVQRKGDSHKCSWKILQSCQCAVPSQIYLNCNFGKDPPVVWWSVMIAFITRNSSLVPCIEGLSAQIHVWWIRASQVPLVDSGSSFFSWVWNLAPVWK